LPAEGLARLSDLDRGAECGRLATVDVGQHLEGGVRGTTDGGGGGEWLSDVRSGVQLGGDRVPVRVPIGAMKIEAVQAWRYARPYQRSHHDRAITHGYGEMCQPSSGV
jgi:hypothetical protein